MSTVDERIERAKANAAADAKRRGLDQAHQREAAREAEELAADPALNRAINDMENRQAAEEEAERRAAVQRQNFLSRKFREDLDKHYQDRLSFYRLSRPGMPKAIFDKDVWPQLRQQYVAGEEDAVDTERARRSARVF